MKRQSVRLITAALVTAGIAGCFSDPTSSLRNGPARIQLTRSAAVVPISDSTLVEARLVDAQGSILPITGASWSTDNAAVADVQVAATQLPADGSSRAYIRGVATLGGITTVRVTARGVTDSIRVTALPTRYLGTGRFAVTGTATADTVPGSVPLVTFTAGDTLTITAPAGITFDATSSVVTLGATRTYLLSRSTTSITVLALKGFRGQATVTNVTWLGNATTGDYSLASLNTTDTVTVARARFRGAAVTSSAAAYNNNTLLTLTAQAGTTFNTSGNVSDVVFYQTGAMVTSRTATTITAIARAGADSVVKVTNVNIGAVRVDSLFTPGRFTLTAAALPNANVTVRNGGFGSNTEMKVLPATGTTFTASGTSASNVVLGATNATVLFRNADSMVVISSANYTGTVKVTNLVSSGLVLDSLRTTSPSTVNAAFFPGTVVQGGTGRLLDTLYVIGGPSADFTTSGTNASTVTINGTQAFIIRRAADTLYAISKRPGTSTVAISNVIAGSSTVPSLSTSGTTVVSATTGEANEPGNDARATSTALAFTGAADTITVFGSVDCEDDGSACPGNGDWYDYYKVTVAGSVKLRAILEWFGNGAAGNPPYGSDPNNPDLDVIICDASGNLSCSYSTATELTGLNGAGLAQPETGSMGAAASTGSYFVRVFGFVTPSPIAYRLRVLRF